MEPYEISYHTMARWKSLKPWPVGQLTHRQSFVEGATRGELLFTFSYHAPQAATAGPPEKGELEVACIAHVNEEVDWMPDLLVSLVYLVSANLSLRFRDSFEPVIHAQLAEVRRQQRRTLSSTPTTITVLSNAPAEAVPAETAQASLEACIRHFADAGDVRHRTIHCGRAARRFMKAEARGDRVDRYLDYWLTCEVLTGHLGADTTPAHARIAEGLAPHLGREGKQGKKLVENGLRLRVLAGHRNEIIHGRRDHVSNEALAQLGRIAKQLLCKELGLGYVADRDIEKAISDYEERKKPETAA